MRLFALVASVLITTIAATAHTRRPGGTWYFDGMTYKKNDPTAREDPVNVIFAPGPADTSLEGRVVVRARAEVAQAHIGRKLPLDGFRDARSPPSRLDGRVAARLA